MSSTSASLLILFVLVVVWVALVIVVRVLRVLFGAGSRALDRLMLATAAFTFIVVVGGSLAIASVLASPGTWPHQVAWAGSMAMLGVLGARVWRWSSGHRPRFGVLF
ncbi:MAG: hypothetical protein AAGI30_13425 [Planctomycetota bacterium]